MHRFLVTGANGFVGKHLCAGLRSYFPEAKIFAITKEGQASFKYVKTYKADIAKDDLSGIINDIQPSFVYHLAARSSVAQALNSGFETFEDNVISCMNLAKAMRAEAKGIPLVFASSGEVYGAAFNKHDAVSEDVPPEPMNAYARSKLAGEFIFKDMLSDVSPVTVLRLFNHYGKGQDERFVMGSFMAQIERIKKGLQEPVIKVGNLEAVRDFLPVEQVIEAYIRLVDENRNNKYEVLNICSGYGRTIQSLLDELISSSGLSITVDVDKNRLRPSEISRAIGFRRLNI